MEKQTYYLISDAAKKVEVESHVLRYWEDELEIPIKRNELGHRYYTEEDVERFREIKNLKEQGLQLKAIRMILKDGKLERLKGDESLESIIDYSGPGEAERKEQKQGQSAGHAQVQGQKQSQTQGKAQDQTQSQTQGQAQDRKQSQAQGQKQSPTQSQKQDQTQSQKQEQRQEQTEKKKAAGNGQKDGNVPIKDIIKDTVRDTEKETLRETACAGTVREEATKEMEASKYRESEQARHMIEVIGQKEAAALQKESREEKSLRLQLLLQHMIAEAVKSNNRELCDDIKESLLKEMDYQFRQQEERDEERTRKEEEHFQKLDELLRSRSRKRAPKAKKEKGERKRHFRSAKTDPAV